MLRLNLKHWFVLSLALIFSACASNSKIEPASGKEKPQLDRALARRVAMGKFTAAQALADSLIATKDPANREIASYWKAICWLNQDEPDSALALLESYRGRWSGGLRRVHSEAFLHLARKSVESRLALRQANLAQMPAALPDKSWQDRAEVLQREVEILRAEVGRLVTEREKYQKLIKDLETIR